MNLSVDVENNNDPQIDVNLSAAVEKVNADESVAARVDGVSETTKITKFGKATTVAMAASLLAACKNNTTVDSFVNTIVSATKKVQPVEPISSPTPAPAPAQPQAVEPTPVVVNRRQAIADKKTQTLAKPNQQQAARFLQQAGLSSTTAEINHLTSIGYEAWIDEQQVKSYQPAWDWMMDKGFNQDRYRWDNQPVYHAVWHQLMTCDDMLRKRVTLALSEIIVIKANDLGIDYRGFAAAAFWDILSQHAFGNYRDLLKDITLSPAMGYYLNTFGNQKANPATGRAPDENFAREILQLFSIGLYELNNDGTLKHINGKPVETYNQDDIVNLARVFTGYKLDSSQYASKPMEFVRAPMIMEPSLHSPEEVNFLNGYIPANTDGNEALDMALDTIFNHPNVAPFISKQLIQRLVTSNPSPEYVSRVAAKFNDNGVGVRGDLKTVVRTILLDKEALNNWQQNDNHFGKIKEPMLRFVQWGRNCTVESYTGKFLIPDYSSDFQLGQTPLESPSVFNFFRPTYTPPNSKLEDEGLVAPEMQLVNVISSATYINFMLKIIEEGTGNWLSVERRNDIMASYADQLTLVNDIPALINRLNLEFTAEQIDSATVAEIINAVESIDINANNGQLRRVWAAVGLIVTSPEFMVLK